MPIPKVPSTAMPFPLSAQQPQGQPQVGLNPAVFEDLIKSHGIRMIHSKPIPCPKQRDLYSGDHDPNCKDCFNGFFYYGQKEFIGAFMGNINNRQFNINGTWDLNQSQITLSTKYLDGTELDVQFFDQILIPDFLVRYYQRVEHSQTGLDRLHFPAKSVDKLVDATGREYFSGIDFIVTESGYIQWTGPKRPGYDLTIDRGILYSVNYYCRPTFTVISLPHQLRVTQAIENGRTVQKRYPSLAICRKEFLPYFRDKAGEPDTPSPRDGQV